MNWNIALVSVIAALVVVIVWLILELRQMDRMHDWEIGAGCPLATKPGDPARPAVGETEWDRLIRQEGNPAAISTSGAEFAMPEAK